MFKAGLNKTVTNGIGKSATGMLTAGMRQVSLSVFLLAQPVALLAESEVTPEPELIATESTAQTSTVAQVRSDVPPPPPGPYKSSALRDSPVERSASGTSSKKSRPPSVMRNQSIGRFSPDRPWPDNLRPTASSHGQSSGRQPANMQPSSMQHKRNPDMHNPTVQNRVLPSPVRKNYPDYRQGAPMSAMPGSRGQYRSYPPGYSPTYQSGYQSNYQSGYRPDYEQGYQPGNNAQYNNPLNRGPYPTQGRP